MNVFLVALCLCVSSAWTITALPVSEGGFLIENEFGEQFYAVPLPQEHNIHKRQTKQTSGGSLDHAGNLDLSHTGTFVNNDRHRLDGTAFAGRNIKHHDSWATGGQLDYAHKPTGSGLTAGAANKPGYGTDAFARGNYNFLNANQGRTTAGVSGEYSRHFGGPGGAGRPNYGAFLNFKHRF